MHVSVIIPFRGDPATLSWVMDGFARQQMPEGWQLSVRILGDGCTPPQPDPPNPIFSISTHEWSGVSEAKNLLLTGVSTDAVIFVNADTRPDPGFVAAHLARLQALGHGNMVLGAAPYDHTGPQTVFDVLKEESPMIFFYSRMKPLQWHDFRHAWTLNLSMWFDDYQKTGGFDKRLRPYGHEDIELAYRLMGDSRDVFYDPAAIVRHRHPMTFADYLNREEGLGLMGPVLRDVSPDVFERLFGTQDIDALAADYRAWVKMDALAHRWIWQRMDEWAEQPDGTLGNGKEREQTLTLLYQMHIPLKRLAFRLGFLRGLELRDDAHWRERKPVGLWRTAAGIE